MKKLKINSNNIEDVNNYIDELRQYLSINSFDKKYFLMTFGCQMNEHDSERMAAILEKIGYLPSISKEEADIIIVNTCAVRENAEKRVFGNLGELKHLKNKNENLILAICGCMVQQKHIVDKINKSYPFVDLMFGTHNYYLLPKYIYEILMNKRAVCEIYDDSATIVEGLPAIRKSGVKAFVNIMEGCNNFCSFCIVPYTRGREKSRYSKNIIEEIKTLALQGVKEITLLGQNVNSYGKSLDEDINFTKLLYLINDIEGIERIRFMTSHPKDLSKELIYAYRDLDKLCEYLHLPVQSGSNRILKAMNRRYTREEYLDKIRLIKSLVPNISISTDILIGFPGETDEDIDDTIDLIKEVEYDSAFTFIYSRRENTPAAKLKDDLDSKTKHKRFQRMLDSLNPIAERKNKEYLGKKLEVLIEDKTRARTRTNALININAKEEDIGKLLFVYVNKANRFSLEGEIIR